MTKFNNNDKEIRITKLGEVWKGNIAWEVEQKQA